VPVGFQNIESESLLNVSENQSTYNTKRVPVIYQYKAGNLVGFRLEQLTIGEPGEGTFGASGRSRY